MFPAKTDQIGICTALNGLAKREGTDVALDKARQWQATLHELYIVASESQEPHVVTLRAAVEFWLMEHAR